MTWLYGRRMWHQVRIEITNNGLPNYQEKRKISNLETLNISPTEMDRFSAVWLGRLAFVPDGRSKSRADSGPNRRPASGGQPSGGRAAFQIPMHALYSTRPHGLVQAIFWHTRPGPRFRSVILLNSLDPHCT